MIDRDSPWQIDDAEYPEEETRSAQLEFLVRYAVLAPSTHNSQPWRFRVRGDALEIIADRSRSLPVCDPQARELTISCGAALQFARLAARNMKREGAIELLPDFNEPDLMARLWLGAASSPTPMEVRRFRAVRSRHTSRTPLAGDAQVDEIVTKLSHAAGYFGIGFHPTSDPKIRKDVAELVEAADRTMMSDPAFRGELSKWIRSSADGRHDGMSVASFGLADLLSGGARAAIRSLDLGESTARKHHDLTLQTPWLGLLSTFYDEPRAWMRTGMALADVVLDITAAGLSCSFLNQPVELEEYRERLAKLFGGDHPQMLMRIGRGSEVPAAARRNIDEVMERR